MKYPHIEFGLHNCNPTRRFNWLRMLLHTKCCVQLQKSSLCSLYCYRCIVCCVALLLDNINRRGYLFHEIHQHQKDQSASTGRTNYRMPSAVFVDHCSLIRSCDPLSLRLVSCHYSLLLASANLSPRVQMHKCPCDTGSFLDDHELLWQSIEAKMLQQFPTNVITCTLCLIFNDLIQMKVFLILERR